MSYEPKLAAALSGATLRQLSHWRRASGKQDALLVPEVSDSRPILYSFRDMVALRACVKLRKETSLQKIRRAVDTLWEDLGEREYLSAYALVAGPNTIYLAEPEQAVVLIRGGNVVIHQLVDVLAPFYKDGRQIPDLLKPRTMSPSTPRCVAVSEVGREVDAEVLAHISPA